MFASFKEWLASPYRQEMDTAHWFYFLGLLIVLTAMWGLILRTIKEVT